MRRLRRAPEARFNAKWSNTAEVGPRRRPMDRPAEGRHQRGAFERAPAEARREVRAAPQVGQAGLHAEPAGEGGQREREQQPRRGEVNSRQSIHDREQQQVVAPRVAEPVELRLAEADRRAEQQAAQQEHVVDHHAALFAAPAPRADRRGVAERRGERDAGQDRERADTRVSSPPPGGRRRCADQRGRSVAGQAQSTVGRRTAPRARVPTRARRSRPRGRRRRAVRGELGFEAMHGRCCRRLGGQA